MSLVLVLNMWVPGEPQPQGSKTMMPAGRRSAVPPRGPCWHHGRRQFSSVAMVEANDKRLRPWREKVTATARALWSPRAPLTGPVTVSMQFVFERPKSHFTARGALRTRAPVEKTSKPDRGKLERAIEDSLKDAGVWADDAQAVASIRSEKRYGPDAGAQIALYVPAELF